MPDLRTLRRGLARPGVQRRLSELEAGLQEQRQLSRRVAELTDLVAELLVPLARHDQDQVDAIVARYRASI